MSVRWDDAVDAILAGDLTGALGYRTPAGGVVVQAVAPIGLRDREAGTVGFTTSLGFSKKLDRIGRDPRVAMAYHAREHGFADGPAYVLVQGRARVVAAPTDAERLELRAHAERHLGPAAEGWFWDRWLREYYRVRVPVGIAVERILAWPDLRCSGEPAVLGAPVPGEPAPDQAPPRERDRPAGGRGPRARGGWAAPGTRWSAGRGRTACRSSPRSPSRGTATPPSPDRGHAAPARAAPRGAARPRLPAAARRPGGAPVHRMARRGPGRGRPLRAAHRDRLSRAAEQAPAAAAQRRAGQARRARPAGRARPPDALGVSPPVGRTARARRRPRGRAVRPSAGSTPRRRAPRARPRSRPRSAGWPGASRRRSRRRSPWSPTRP